MDYSCFSIIIWALSQSSKNWMVASIWHALSNLRTQNFSLIEWTHLYWMSLLKGPSKASSEHSSSLLSAEHQSLWPEVASKVYFKAAIQVIYILATQICTLEEWGQKKEGGSKSSDVKNITSIQGDYLIGRNTLPFKWLVPILLVHWMMIAVQRKQRGKSQIEFLVLLLLLRV